jgi:hypothetical protein
MMMMMMEVKMEDRFKIVVVEIPPGDRLAGEKAIRCCNCVGTGELCKGKCFQCWGKGWLTLAMAHNRRHVYWAAQPELNQSLHQEEIAWLEDVIENFDRYVTPASPARKRLQHAVDTITANRHFSVWNGRRNIEIDPEDIRVLLVNDTTPERAMEARANIAAAINNAPRAGKFTAWAGPSGRFIAECAVEDLRELIQAR